ncbi:MAG: IclR family transcriptional regulator, acetate operon repressor [Thermoleophilaceae bacterium]|nr:IclR family transcriptional regulator, acetate operon repressor [Thermoleophilaceae bacterium]
MLASGDGRSPRVQSVERAADLLQAVARANGTPATVRELAVAAGLNRATAWRILRTLETRGLVHRNPYTRDYTIGSTVVDLARAAPTDTWSTRAHEKLRTLALQTRETMALALSEDGELRYVDEVLASEEAGTSWLGTTAEPLHATSAGKVYLAYARRPLNALVRDPLEQFTETTVTLLQALEEELAQVRSEGYALCRGEFYTDKWGVSAPMLTADQRLLGVLSCWGPASRGEPERFAALGTLIRDAARELAST